MEYCAARPSRKHILARVAGAGDQTKRSPSLIHSFIYLPLCIFSVLLEGSVCLYVYTHDPLAVPRACDEKKA